MNRTNKVIGRINPADASVCQRTPVFIKRKQGFFDRLTPRIRGCGVLLLLVYFLHKMCSVLQTINESFAFVVCAKAAAEIADGVVIIQGQYVQKPLQFLKALADLWWI